MNVLLVSQYYPPEPVPWVREVAVRLQTDGHRVSVLTGFPCYPKGAVYPGYRQRPWQTEVDDGITVRRVPQLPDHSRSGLRRALYYLSFCASAAALGAFGGTRPDVILVYQSAVPTGLAALWLGRLLGAPVVFYVTDLWPESVASSGMLRHPLANAVLQTACDAIYRAADFLVPVTPGFARRLTDRGCPVDRTRVVYYWLPEHLTENRSGHLTAEDVALLRDRFTVIFAGNMGPSQGLETVLEAADRLRDQPDIAFLLVGDGLSRLALMEEARRRGLTNVHFPGSRPAGYMPLLYERAGALLVHLKRDSLSVLSIPSKTYSYMAAGRPILLAVDGTAGEFARAEGCAIPVPSSDPVALAEAVRNLARLPPDRREGLGQAARASYRRTIAAEVQAPRLAAILRRVAEEF